MPNTVTRALALARNAKGLVTTDSIAIDLAAATQPAIGSDVSGNERAEAPPGCNGRSIRNLRHVRLVANVARGVFVSLVAIAALTAAGIGVPAYGQVIAVAVEETGVEASFQNYTVPTDAPVTPIARDSYSVIAPPAAVWPVGAHAPISSGYGPRISCAACSSFHKGLDFTPGSGTPVHAAAKGTVVNVGSSSGGLGQSVRIRHVIDGQEVETVYGHMQRGSILVATGQTVHTGQQIGRVGNTGVSTGPHLHFEVHVGGSAINPLGWLRNHAG